MKRQIVDFGKVFNNGHCVRQKFLSIFFVLSMISSNILIDILHEILNTVVMRIVRDLQEPLSQGLKFQSLLIPDNSQVPESSRGLRVRCARSGTNCEDRAK